MTYETWLEDETRRLAISMVRLDVRLKHLRRYERAELQEARETVRGVRSVLLRKLWRLRQGDRYG